MMREATVLTLGGSLLTLHSESKGKVQNWRENTGGQRHSQSMREVYAPNLRDGTITVTLQQLYYLITERAVIKQQAADVF
jgi:hypothetical protein